MRLKRKKTGSSLIFVVIIFMFIIIVSIGMLSMSAGNYRARAVESKRVENLYGAESGLDIAYNVIAKTIDNANQYSYIKVEEFKNDVEDINYNSLSDYKDSTNCIENSKANLYILKADKEYQKNIKGDDNAVKRDDRNIDMIINYVFRYYFEQYIDNNIVSNIKGKDNDGTKGKYLIDARRPENDSNISEVSYNNAELNFQENSIEKSDTFNKLKWIKKPEDLENISVEKLVEEYHYEYKRSEDKYILKTTEASINYEQYKNITAPVDLISMFKIPSDIGENERKIEAKFFITVPNYDEVTFEKHIESGKDEIPGLTIGGSLNVNKSKMDVYGDIMVEGNSENAFTLGNKYTDGIFIDNGDSTSSNPNMINFYSNVFCRKTVNVKDNVAVNINKNMYAKNIYINSTNTNKGSYLGINENNSKVVLNNDLEMSAFNAVININSFYGINDKNDSSSKDEKSQNSSSIIINKQNTNSFLTIDKDAYIRGVAHIDTENGYKTGESVAVKGNYGAYSIALDSTDRFTYDNPLMLLEEDSQNPNKRIEHFYKYWSNGSVDTISEARSELDYGGVIFKNINLVHSIGDIVYGEISDEDKSVRKKIKKADDDGTNGNYNKIINDEKSEYAKNIYNLNVDQDKKIGKTYVYNNDNNDSIKDIINSEYHNNIERENFNFIYGDYSIPNNKYKGVLVVNGDLNVNSNCEIEGDLIVLGNVNVNSGAKLVLKYDKELTKSIQNKNLTYFKLIFSDYGKDEEFIEGEEVTTESNSARFINRSIWRILK